MSSKMLNTLFLLIVMVAFIAVVAIDSAAPESFLNQFVDNHQLSEKIIGGIAIAYQ